jgi:hypothetical protein
MSTTSRDYRREYDTFHATEAQKKRRAARNKARRMMEKNGRVSKGDGKEVDHKNKNPLDNSPDNLRIRSRTANRRDQ